MSKKTGTDSTKPLPIIADAPRFSPSTARKARTMRSAAPLRIMASPITAARAMTIPMAPAVAPKASTTRTTGSVNAAADSGTSAPTRKLTTRAAVRSARKAFTRRRTIPPSTTAMPMARIRNGYQTPGVSSGASSPGPRSVTSETRAFYAEGAFEVRPPTASSADQGLYSRTTS